MFKNTVLSQHALFGLSSYAMQDNKGKYLDVGFFLFFAAIVIVRFHSVLNSYWLYDDPYILRHTMEHIPWESFFVPSVWREMSMSYLTPWVTSSFDLDLRLFGLQPRYFYFHQLISIWLASVALYGVLKLWLKQGFAAIGSLMFLFSAPAAAAAEMLQIRHYIEGLIFCLLAVFFFVAAIRKESVLYSIASALFYLLAMSAKELYVPLFAVLLFLPEGRTKKRIVSAIPLAAAAVLYVIWRRWMLGDFIGGPGGESALNLYRGKEAIGLFLKNIYGTVVMTLGVSTISNWATPVLVFYLFSFFALSAFCIAKEKRYSELFFFVVVFFAVYSVPLLAYHPFLITNDFAAYRLIFLIAAYLSIVVSLSSFFLYGKAGSLRRNSLQVALKTTVILLTIVAVLLVQWNSFLWLKTESKKTIRPLVDEGRFFMSAAGTAVLEKSDPVYCGTHYYENLEFFRTRYFKEQPPVVVYNGFAYIDAHEADFPAGLQVFKYNAEMGKIVDSTGSFFKERDAYMSRIRKLPLSVRLTVDHGLIDLAMGPSHLGHYFLLWGHKPGLYSMYIDLGPQRNITRRGLTRFKVYWRVGWESPEGWITFSPEWFIDLSKKQSIAWEQ